MTRKICECDDCDEIHSDSTDPVLTHPTLLKIPGGAAEQDGHATGTRIKRNPSANENHGLIASAALMAITYVVFMTNAMIVATARSFSKAENDDKDLFAFDEAAKFGGKSAGFLPKLEAKL